MELMATNSWHKFMCLQSGCTLLAGERLWCQKPTFLPQWWQARFDVLEVATVLVEEEDTWPARTCPNVSPNSSQLTAGRADLFQSRVVTKLQSSPIASGAIQQRRRMHVEQLSTTTKRSSL